MGYNNTSVQGISSNSTNLLNITLPEYDAAKLQYQQIRQISYGYILPTILALGILGNCINIAVFSQRRLWLTQDVMEKSAMIGLLSLAVADLLFCIVGFPSAFVKVRRYIGPDEYSYSAAIALYYTTYRSNMLNIFVFMSTRFIIILSVERYFAIVHPFRAKRVISVQRTLLMKVIVVTVSIVINIPDFLRYNIRHIECESQISKDCLFIEPNPLLYGNTLAVVYSIIWHCLGTFVPLITLTFCNVCLLMEIYKSVSHTKKIGRSKHHQDPRPITVILVLIVFMFLLLVCPSMLLTFLTECVLQSPTVIVQNYRIALIITNLSQALNFAGNFLLYCAFSPKFRILFLHSPMKLTPD